MNTDPLTPREKALLVGSPCLLGLLAGLGAFVWWAIEERTYWRRFRLTD